MSKSFAADFEASMSRQMAAIENLVIKEQKDISIALFSSVIDNTPIFTGFLASNIKVSFDGSFSVSPDESERNPSKPAEFFPHVQSNRVQQVQKLLVSRLPNTVTIGTAVSYAPPVEAGDFKTFSGNAPMFANAVANVKATFNIG